MVLGESYKSIGTIQILEHLLIQGDGRKQSRMKQLRLDTHTTHWGREDLS